MIKRGTEEWKTFISRLDQIKTKSNREVLCIKCWQMLNCKQKIKHLKAFKGHDTCLLTSTQYASEEKITSLARLYDQLVTKDDGHEYMISPFAPLYLPSITPSDKISQGLDIKKDSDSTNEDSNRNKNKRPCFENRRKLANITDGQESAQSSNFVTIDQFNELKQSINHIIEKLESIVHVQDMLVSEVFKREKEQPPQPCE